MSYFQDDSSLDLIQRAVLSHRMRLKYDSLIGHDDLSMISTWDLENLNKSPELPNPAQQLSNIIRYFGEMQQIDFAPIKKIPPEFNALVGSPTRNFALKLVLEARKRGWVQCAPVPTLDNPYNVINVDLTLAGWEIFQAEKRGQIESSTGFIALKFGDHQLDGFLAEHVKPDLMRFGYQLVDLRDVSRAGVIDNILRAQIRDAAFVVVDLTHDNAGAYWEAGYAEGLGKPVIYMCEKSKFDETKTHFDTNHCTTVMWDISKPSEFIDTLVSTIRRSPEI